MDNIILGAIALLALVGIQIGFRYLTVFRTRRAWEGAQADLSRGDFAAAEQGIAHCIKLMPLWLQPRFLMGAVLAKQGKLAEAEEQLKMAQALQPRQPEGFIELGIFYITSASREEDGLRAFREALTHDAGAWHRLESDPRLAAFRQSSAYQALQLPATEE